MTDTIGTMSLLCGFLIIFSGVYLLNYPGGDTDARKTSDERLAGAIADRAGDVRRRFSLQTLPPRFSDDESQYEDRDRDRDRTGLMRSYVAGGGRGGGRGGEGHVLRDLSRHGEEGVDENE